MDKSELRKKAKQIRKSLKIDIISEQIVYNIRNSSLYQDAKNVMIFYPMKDEINLLPLLDDDKQFYLPRVNGDYIEICEYRKQNILKKSALGIYEPITCTQNPSILDIIYTPALMCDKDYCRLGYGGGYYDKFFKNSTAKKIIVIPEELTCESLPKEKFDILCDGIITQKKASF